MTWLQVALIAALIVWGWFHRRRRVIEMRTPDLVTLILICYALFSLAAIDVVTTAMEVFLEALRSPGLIG